MSLNLALRNAWDEVGHFLFDDERSERVGGEKVRQFMRSYLDSEHPSTNLMVHKFWRPLSDAERTKALADAFPDESYDRHPCDDETDEGTRD